MPGELARRTTSGLPVSRSASRELGHIGNAVRIEQATLRAKSRVGEFALYEVTYLKAVQRELEHANPDAGEAIGLIVNTTIAGMARSVAQFGSEID